MSANCKKPSRTCDCIADLQSIADVRIGPIATSRDRRSAIHIAHLQCNHISAMAFGDLRFSALRHHAVFHVDDSVFDAAVDLAHRLSNLLGDVARLLANRGDDALHALDRSGDALAQA